MSDESSEFSATDGPAAACVFCPEPVEADAAEAEIVLMSDYMDTPLDEDTPGRRVGLCHTHAEQLRERVPTTDELVVR